jgi:hypothetical protein
MKCKVTVREVQDAFRSLTAIGKANTTGEVALAIAQNIRVLQMEMKTIAATRQEAVNLFQADVRVVPNARGDNVYMPYPEGWNHDNEDQNSEEMWELRRTINDAFTKMMVVFNESPITLDIRGLDPKTEIPKNGVTANDIATCAFLFNDFVTLKEKDEPVEEPKHDEVVTGDTG